MHKAAVKHQLIVFSDDWGRHPSSCQHLVARLVKSHPTLWVNTIGMRPPSLSWEDLSKASQKLKEWMGRAPESAASEQVVIPENMRVINPRMWPGFRTNWQRKLNARWVSRAIADALGPREEGEKRTVITTLPITADLIGKLDADAWVYYCVDDFSLWPGLDARVMLAMEKQQVAKVDKIACVSQTLSKRLSDMGRSSTMLTHGIDLDHWQASYPAEASQTDLSTPQSGSGAPKRFFGELSGPILLFWGLIDTRLDMSWCKALSEAGLGSIVMVGPVQQEDKALAQLPGVTMWGQADYKDLPAMAQEADVLLMPYADLPVTRAMQPLKFKEYLATGKPVVARALPGITDWADAADLVNDQASFIASVKERLAHGASSSQLAARDRLAEETWDHKAQILASLIAG